MADTDALIAVKDLTLAYGSYMVQQHYGTGVGPR
jgi:hypothetical protein